MKETENEFIGRKMRTARFAAGLTLAEVEDITDGAFKASIVGGYERADRGMSVARFLRLCKLYNVTPARILGDATAPTLNEAILNDDRFTHTQIKSVLDILRAFEQSNAMKEGLREA